MHSQDKAKRERERDRKWVVGGGEEETPRHTFVLSLSARMIYGSDRGGVEVQLLLFFSSMAGGSIIHRALISLSLEMGMDARPSHGALVFGKETSMSS